MTKFIHDEVLDAPIDKIIAEADRVIWIDTFSNDYTTITTNAIGSYIPTITKANGDTSGRKGTIQASSGISVDADGTFNHFAVVDDDASKVLYVGEAGASKPLTVGDTVDAPATDIEFSDPS
ncbi:hypothetical protein tloyanaT_26390 [Thalassotalea loyana]|uniref:Uncharacterized protein n=1 Tax=Thalassotalea loyana TaxID=280483 RepID=A0ABQ6HHK8_9GAMM|nr:hypothetical protein [Thalassotalea loyana]GLX86386.1 hypothetical protein tloyanaT_26390 [Thalassotalea loyana]